MLLILYPDLFVFCAWGNTIRLFTQYKKYIYWNIGENSSEYKEKCTTRMIISEICKQYVQVHSVKPYDLVCKKNCHDRGSKLFRRIAFIFHDLWMNEKWTEVSFIKNNEWRASSTKNFKLVEDIWENDGEKYLKTLGSS